MSEDTIATVTMMAPPGVDHVGVGNPRGGRHYTPTIASGAGLATIEAHPDDVQQLAELGFVLTPDDGTLIAIEKD